MKSSAVIAFVFQSLSQRRTNKFNAKLLSCRRTCCSPVSFFFFRLGFFLCCLCSVV